MLEIEIDLRRHCIETAIKRSYNQLLSEYFHSKKGDSASETKLALLQNALTCFDFPSLRAGHKNLAGKSDARIVLADKGECPPGILIDGRPIDMTPHIRKCHHNGIEQIPRSATETRR
ncbi:hypothetical protein [Desulfococcus sp.]|jgi:hypothetical protein|uniref:hypothetical protein n=1 Tax=Desulfococcus sp. TaxID=2025834 RepID=UPI003D09A07B